MMPEIYFTGQTERFFLNVLEQDGKLHFEYVYKFYSSKHMARNFLQKVVSFGIATISSPGVLTWIPPNERGKKNADVRNE